MRALFAAARNAGDARFACICSLRCLWGRRGVAAIWRVSAASRTHGNIYITMCVLVARCHSTTTDTMHTLAASSAIPPKRSQAIHFGCATTFCVHGSVDSINFICIHIRNRIFSRCRLLGLMSVLPLHSLRVELVICLWCGGLSLCAFADKVKEKGAICISSRIGVTTQRRVCN